MNDFLALDISGAGMRVQRQRMQVVAENLANQKTTGPDGPYQRKEVVVRAIPMTEFQRTLEGELVRSNGEVDEATQGVAVSEVRPDQEAPTRVFDPSHPHADAQGYVSYPNISVFREMTDMIESQRMYEANLSASRSTREMLTSALDLIRR